MKRTGLLVLLLLGWSAQVQAQALVLDIANLAQNVLQVIQTILIVENQVLDLTGLDDIVLGDGYSADLETLRTLVEEARGLSSDISSLTAQVSALFDLATAPDTRAGLTARLAEIKRVTWQTRLYAMRTQTLMHTTLSTVRHLTRLIEALGEVVGAKQNQQTLNQVDATLGKQLAVLEVHTAAYQQSEVLDKMGQDLVIESINRISQRRLEGWPTW